MVLFRCIQMEPINFSSTDGRLDSSKSNYSVLFLMLRKPRVYRHRAVRAFTFLGG